MQTHGSGSNQNITIIKPSVGWQVIDFRELIAYRDLFFFLAWRDIKTVYAQTILGFMWAILQPGIQIVLFALIFGKVAQLPTDGIPYLLFVTTAIIPWTYMQSAMTSSSQSLVSNQGMLGKVYFPRLIFPIVPIMTSLVDFVISLAIVLLVLVYYQIAPTMNLLYFPFFLLMMMTISAGVGMWLSALAIRYRDVKFAMGFAMRMLMYTAPVVYSATTIPEAYRFLYSLNPIVGVIEGFRASLLGTPMPWVYIIPGVLVGGIVFVSGALYFRKMEKIFVDVI